MSERRSRAAEASRTGFACAEGVRLPDERSEESCEARSQEAECGFAERMPGRRDAASAAQNREGRAPSRPQSENI